MADKTFDEFIRARKNKPVPYYVLALVTDAIKKLQQTIKELETRLAAMEAQPLLKSAGIWRHGSTYRPGDVAQFKGARWVCTRAHTASGAPDHACWQLWEKTAR